MKEKLERGEFGVEAEIVPGPWLVIIKLDRIYASGAQLLVGDQLGARQCRRLVVAQIDGEARHLAAVELH